MIRTGAIVHHQYRTFKTHEQILRDQRDKSLRMYTTLRNSKLLVAAMCYNNKCKQADGAVPS